MAVREGINSLPSFSAKASLMLPSWVSSCEIDGQVVFLDVLANRYSRLEKEAASALGRGDVDSLQPSLRRLIEDRHWLNSNAEGARSSCCAITRPADRKSTRLNSSH